MPIFPVIATRIQMIEILCFTAYYVIVGILFAHPPFGELYLDPVPTSESYLVGQQDDRSNFFVISGGPDYPTRCHE